MWCPQGHPIAAPGSNLGTARDAAFDIMKWGAEHTGQSEAAETFASMRDAREKSAAAPNAHIRIEPLPGVGDEAFQETTNYDVVIRARKDDLIFSLSLGMYSPQTQPNAVALAAQV